MSPRYPRIHVTVRSGHPLALVGAVRMALRHAGIGAPEIDRFSDLAMGSTNSQHVRTICNQWVHLRSPRPGRATNGDDPDPALIH